MSFKRIIALTVAALLLHSSFLLQADETLQVPQAVRVQTASKDKKVREQAIRDLAGYGVAAIPILEHVFLDDGGWAHAASMREERLLALASLATINSRDSIPTLVLAAGDWDEDVRKEAERQLLTVDGVTLDELRNHWLLTEDWFLRQGAMITLMDHGITADVFARTPFMYPGRGLVSGLLVMV
jgi:HEAT repeat protein